ncbi:MAG: sigma-70 family RNA polymerase sigma factor [Clostridia bacterium]|nr:sigma-70 family RNA polymerase sigma factor [Clostridia bacterium]
MDYEKMTDEALAKAFIDGDQTAFETLYRRYGQTVRYVASSYALLGYDKDDLLQEGYLGLVNAAKNFDKEKAKRSSASFRTYATSYVRFSVRNAVFRASGADDRLTDDVIECVAGEGPSPDEVYIGNESWQSIVDGIKAMLSDFEATVFDYYVHGYRYQEIAEKLSLPAKKVDNAIQRIKEKCRQSKELRALIND